MCGGGGISMNKTLAILKPCKDGIKFSSGYNSVQSWLYLLISAIASLQILLNFPPFIYWNKEWSIYQLAIFLTHKGKKNCETPLYYIANVVDKENILLPSSCHLLSSVKATDYKTIFNHSRFESEHLGRKVCSLEWWYWSTSLTKTTVITEALNNLKPELR